MYRELNSFENFQEVADMLTPLEVAAFLRHYCTPEQLAGIEVVVQADGRRRAERLDALGALELLGRRPQCVHGLNGPCRECGPPCDHVCRCTPGDPRPCCDHRGAEHRGQWT